MIKELKIKNCFLMMIYGDALGFSYENNEGKELKLSPFIFKYNDTIALAKDMGQWSDLTELLLIQTKALMDLKEKTRVRVDYERQRDELMYWKTYRNGKAPTTLQYSMEDLSQRDDYWRDKRGYGFSRVVSLVLANKNYNYALDEIYHQILQYNRHPQVILTGLLLSRSLYLLLEREYELKELVAELKGYLIGLRLQQLEGIGYEALPREYILQFEREKIDLLLALDRLGQGNKNLLEAKFKEVREIFLLSLLYFYQLREEGKITLLPEVKQDIREAIALAYCFWGACLDELPSEAGNIKDWNFVNSMGEYLIRIRNYEVGRREYTKSDFVDIFLIQENRTIKHPIFNNMKVIKRKEERGYIIVDIISKAGGYTFLQKKKERQ